MAWLPEALREELMMTAKSLYPQSDFAREHFGKGRVEGRAEGRVEGRAEGEAAVLRRQLSLRFGPVPARLEQRLQAADAETLLRWAERILTAATPDEVFDG
jgi:predicted transposase YdaD